MINEFKRSTNTLNPTAALSSTCNLAHHMTAEMGESNIIPRGGGGGGHASAKGKDVESKPKKE